MELATIPQLSTVEELVVLPLEDWKVRPAGRRVARKVTPLGADAALTGHLTLAPLTPRLKNMVCKIVFEFL